MTPFYEWQNTNKIIHGNLPLLLDLVTCAHNFKTGVQVTKLNGIMHLAMYNDKCVVWLTQNSILQTRFSCSINGFSKENIILFVHSTNMGVS